MRIFTLFLICFLFAFSGNAQADFGIYLHKNFALNKSKVFPCPQKTNGEHLGIDVQYKFNKLTLINRLGLARFKDEGYQYFPAAWFSTFVWGQKDTYNLEHSLGLRYSFFNKNKWEIFAQLNADSHLRLTPYCDPESDCITILKSKKVYNFQAEVISGVLYKLGKQWEGIVSIGIAENFQNCNAIKSSNLQLGLALRYALAN